MNIVDLHMHTTYSDGTFSPRELLNYCKEKGLQYISITDHDTMAAYNEAEDIARELNITLIPGIEISADYSPGTMHILGYYVHRHNEKLSKMIHEVQQHREERNPKIIGKLNALGINISMEELFEEGSDEKDTQIGRPHIANILLRKGYVKNKVEAFTKYLAKGSTAYVPKKRVQMKRAIETIVEAGGVASLAHPIQMQLDDEALENQLVKLMDYGLSALEVYSSCQGTKQNSVYKKIAKKLGLAITGGSDFHGTNKPSIDLSFLGKNVELGYDVIQELEQKRY